MGAIEFISNAVKHLKDRAVTYDAPSGERSMRTTVKMFNAATGNGLTTAEGWLFMMCLKIARTRQGMYKPDNYEDLVAYAGLYAEEEENVKHIKGGQ